MSDIQAISAWAFAMKNYFNHEWSNMKYQQIHLLLSGPLWICYSLFQPVYQQQTATVAVCTGDCAYSRCHCRSDIFSDTMLLAGSERRDRWDKPKWQFWSASCAAWSRFLLNNLSIDQRRRLGSRTACASLRSPCWFNPPPSKAIMWTLVLL